MRTPSIQALICAMFVAVASPVWARQAAAPERGGAAPNAPKPADTEVWEPVPKAVTPGAADSGAPSDAIVLFNGTNLDEWVSTRDKSAAGWTVANGVLTVNKGAGNI